MKPNKTKKPQGKAGWTAAFPKQSERLNQPTQEHRTARLLARRRQRVNRGAGKTQKTLTSPFDRKPIRSRTSKRAAEVFQYNREVKEWLLLPANQWCAVWRVSPDFRIEYQKQNGSSMFLRATQCHHRFGRRGKLLLWRTGWVFVSAAGHAWIEQNKTKAIALGLLGPVGTYNDYDRAVKYLCAERFDS